MEHTMAMQIVGGVGLLIGLRMNIDPVGFNKSIFGDVEGIDSGESSAMRMAIGGAIWAMAIINLYCGFNVEDAAAGEAILTGTAIGLAAFLGTIAGAKFRGYTDKHPYPSDGSPPDAHRNMPVLSDDVAVRRLIH
ncbi:MAG: hypothetical protein CM1200mP32_08150 [Methanobacteriota archaeon]|nr:MAG: hypothetical protein CM1200mP32_08150 [Euryarchaeota archaeon]